MGSTESENHPDKTTRSSRQIGIKSSRISKDEKKQAV